MSRDNNTYVHFIGIGGIGISGLARIYLEKGYKVSGSDLVGSDITDILERLGAKIKIGKHQKANLPSNTDLVVYNLAILEDNPELKKAKKRGIKCLAYPEALGELTRQYFTICVSGTHGKTTTTALIALILLAAGLDPTVIIGSRLKELGEGNARLGKSRYLVIEADEYKKAFLNYKPQIIVITNIEAEHLDYYKNLKDVQRAFIDFVKLLPRKGVVVTNDRIVKLLALNRACSGLRLDCYIVKKLTSFLSLRGRSPELAEGRLTKQSPLIKIINYKKGPKDKIRKVLQIPGKHNVSNALAAYAYARHLDIDEKIIFKTLSKYKGAWRRFEIKYDKKITIIDDYAHHPTEIRATLQAARERYGKRRIWCIFQPHQIERTKKLFRGFLKAFNNADKIIITKIFGVAGREDKGVTDESLLSKKLSQKLVQGLTKQGLKAIYSEQFEDIINYLEKNIRSRDVVIVMGAGDINKLTPRLLKAIKNQGL